MDIPVFLTIPVFQSTSKGVPKVAVKGLQREAWMTDYLPVSEKLDDNLKARKFRQNPGPVSGIDPTWFNIAGSTSEANNSVSYNCFCNKKILLQLFKLY